MAGDPKVEIEKALRQALGQIAPGHADFPFVFERPKQAGHGDSPVRDISPSSARARAPPSRLVRFIPA